MVVSREHPACATAAGRRRPALNLHCIRMPLANGGRPGGDRWAPDCAP